MKNILLVFTGGTIGSMIARDGVINTNPNANFRLLNLFAEQNGNGSPVQFKVLRPLQILSENLHPGDWTRIVEAIEAEELSQFAGVIVTHGTDTLAFSAAALGLYFNRLKIPLLLVSSDLPLENPQANGLPNFQCAVEFILRIREGGVFVAYKNTGEIMRVFRATRLASCLQLDSRFIGIQSAEYMSFDDGEFRRRETPTDIRPTAMNLKPDFSPRVLLIRPYPGMDYSQYNIEGYDAVLHDLYHSGTACVSKAWGTRHSLVDFIEGRGRRSIPVYLAPAVKTGNAYDSTSALLNSGAEMIWNMSLEAAYAKLLLAYGNFTDRQEIKNFLERDIAWEHV